MRREKVTRTLHKIEWTIATIDPQTLEKFTEIIETDIIRGTDKKILREINKKWMPTNHVAVYILGRAEKNYHYEMDWQTYLKYAKGVKEE